MAQRPPISRRRALRPGCERLESLGLLSTMAMPAVPVNLLAADARGASTGVTVALPSTPTESISTLPGNVDDHPVGVAIVPGGFTGNGVTRPGDILVTNANNKGVPGLGSTIEEVVPATRTTPTVANLFFQGQGSEGVGLTGAVGYLKGGFEIVGNLPRGDTSPRNLGQSLLLLLDRNGNVSKDIEAPGGPWGLTVHDEGKTAQVFVSNVLDGSVTRVDLSLGAFKVRILRSVTIAAGYAHEANPAASWIGPAGLAYDAAKDTLYVASTADNTIYAVAHAGAVRHSHGTGTALIQDPAHLHGPVGLATGPQDTLVVSNNDQVNPDPAQPSTIVLYTRGGQYLGEQSLNATPGALSGISLEPAGGRTFTLAAADAATDTVDLYKGQC